MSRYLFLMHKDSTTAPVPWDDYIAALRKMGRLQGGSAIGDGATVRKAGTAAPLTREIVGYMCLTADSLDDARALLKGNPVFEACGTVEIRELPETN